MRFRSTFALLIVFVAFSACYSPRTENGPANTPTAARTPAPPLPEAVQTPANVSFSTYSKDWPVGWQWIDPDEDMALTPHDVKKGVLRVRVPPGKDLSEERSNAPRYLKSLSGDFQIETRVRFSPAANYQGAGLLIFADARTYLRFEHGYGGPNGGAAGLRIDIRTPQSGQQTAISTSDLPLETTPEVDLRIVRKGNEITALYRLDENAEWREAGNYTIPMPPALMAGIVVCNTARGAIAEFQYIRLLPIAS